jgi:thiosulfate/3-mercaptopyruvate sulfurtransferase
MRLLTAFLLGLVGVSSALAAGAIVDTQFVLEAQKRGAVIWDVRATPDYRKGHIPGAVSIGDTARVLRNDNTEDFIATPQIEKLLGEAGIDPAREIVVYATRGNANAYFTQFAVRYFGGGKVYVYHDGIDGWRAAGLALATDDVKLPAVALKLAPTSSLTVSTDEMIAALKRPEVQIVDVRTVREHLGDDIRAIRGGHIPGAVNIPYEQNWVDPETPAKLARKQVADNRGMALKPRDDLAKLYARLDPAKETLVYCQSGVRAAETAAVLAELGFSNVKVYDSSWLGYAGRLEAPANNQVFLNVGALNGRIAGLQARLEQLERELAEARGRK